MPASAGVGEDHCQVDEPAVAVCTVSSASSLVVNVWTLTVPWTSLTLEIAVAGSIRVNAVTLKSDSVARLL